MNISPSFDFSSRRQAFTLLELLVVISIIAVLAGILLPVTGSVMDNARKTEARTVMQSIVNAVKLYQTEYGQYPVAFTGTAGAKDVTFYGTGDQALDGGKGGRNAYLFNVLKATNDVGPGTSAEYKALNARKVSYFEAKTVKNVSDPRGGFIPSTIPAGQTLKKDYNKDDLIDPWGVPYFIRMDSDYDDKVVNPYPAQDSTTPGGVGSAATNEATTLRTAVIAWASGKDKLLGDKTGKNLNSSADDVASWQ
jgi:prepilin-type N-terminal cleavage/methylation domain-containing protein